MLHSIHELAEDIRRQVKKHREKRRKRQPDAQAIGAHAGPQRRDLRLDAGADATARSLT